MTRDEILNMPAGREMDDLIAINVMNWAIGDRGAHYIGNDGKNVYFVIAGDFEPSTDIAAAWRVVEKMESEDFWFEFSNVIPNSDPIVYEARFQKSIHMGYACEETAPLAICRAALLAVGEFAQ